MTAELREHDVVRYVPERSWCREGLAVAHRADDGSLALFDTYWQFDRTHVTPASFEVLFNVDEYRRVDHWTWDRHAPADRRVVTHQHGLQRDLYVRKGAVESREQIVANARAELAHAEEEVRAAVFMRDGAQHLLDNLLADADAERLAPL